MPSSALPLGRARPLRRPFAGPSRTLPQQNPRPLVLVAPQQAPDPPRAGDTPARPARMPIYLFTNIRAFQAVAQDEFFIRRFVDAPPPKVSQPRGRMATWRERVNIDAPLADSYGIQFATARPQGEQLAVYAGMP